MHKNTALPQWKEHLLLLCLAIPLGIVVGIVDTVFGRVLLAVSAWRDASALLFLPFLPLIGSGIVFLYETYGKQSARGMQLIFSVGHGEEDEIPLRLVPLIILCTWLTHLFGGSAGREGVAVQIGAAISHRFCSCFPSLAQFSRTFLIMGMAAGFGGLFQTPLAATLFAVEVLVAGSLQVSALLPSFFAAEVACLVSASLGLEKFAFAVTPPSFSAALLAKLLLCGILFGLVGNGFSFFLQRAKKLFATRFPHPISRIFLMGICLSILLILLHGGRYAGLGTNLIQYSFTQQPVYAYDWILKLLLTVFTLSIGFQGGEVTPLFSIGASLGVLLAAVLGLPIPFAAALGYAAVFGSASNTFFAPILIGAEVFGFASFPYFIVVMFVAYLCNQNRSIYSAQKCAPWLAKIKRSA